MFQPVDQKQSFPKLEHDMLDYWAKNQTFEKSVEARKEGKKFVFFDGPPFANGLPHYGHILANALKDAVTRYWDDERVLCASNQWLGHAWSAGGI